MQNLFFQLLQEVIVRRKLWDFKASGIQNLQPSSSFSDNNEYLSIVSFASKNDLIFGKFRSCKSYRKILEHVSAQQGQQYLSDIKELNPNYKNLLSGLRHIDQLGNPLRYYYSRIGLFSPTTLRYVHVHLKLIQFFKSIEGLNVIEIGGGYGGQAAISTCLIPNLSWNIYDLPTVLALQKKFIDTATDNSDVKFYSGLEIVEIPGDLLISNYALSEVSRELQIEYFEKVVKKCNRGYMTWNNISETEMNGLTIHEVLSYLPSATVLDEQPETNTGNKIILWGNTKW